MTWLLARATGCAIFGALAGAAAMILLSGLAPHFTIEMTQDRPGLLQGFYGGEREGQLTFAWTADHAQVPLWGLDRNVAWTARIRLRGGRRDPASLPIVTILADGLPIATHQTTNTFEDVVATIPAQSGYARGVTLGLAVSNTFVPGPSDPRRLGVQVDRIALAPVTLGAFPPRRTVAGAALASAIFGAIFGLLGATATTAVAAATLLAVAQAAVLRVGLGPFSPWLALVESLAASIGIALLLLALLIERVRHERLRNTARFALMFTGSALYLHLLVLLHPDKTLADAVFHAHRLEMVMGGGYQFRYPIALYVAALPVAGLIADHVRLLWVVAAVAEAISFLFFYWMIVRGTGDRILAAVAVAIVQLMPLGFSMIAAGGLTNVFGQAMAVITMSLATSAILDRRPWQFWATGGVALVAFLSHITTFATLSAMLASAALLLVTRGATPARRAGILLLATLATAVLVALGVCYRDVAATDVVVSTFSTAYQMGGASIPSRAAAVLPTAVSRFGWPFLLLATTGLVLNVRAGRRDAWWLLIWGWLLGGLGLLVVGVLTPVDFRHYYAAMPAVAVLAASAVVTLWRSRGQLRALAVVSSAAGAALAVNEWLGVLGANLF
jgi:hypothetical protein